MLKNVLVWLRRRNTIVLGTILRKYVAAALMRYSCCADIVRAWCRKNDTPPSLLWETRTDRGAVIEIFAQNFSQIPGVLLEFAGSLTNNDGRLDLKMVTKAYYHNPCLQLSLRLRRRCLKSRGLCTCRAMKKRTTPYLK